MGVGTLALPAEQAPKWGLFDHWTFSWMNK
jgi:hypothetical protein